MCSDPILTIVKSIWPNGRTLTATTPLGQRRPGSNENEMVALYSPELLKWMGKVWNDIWEYEKKKKTR